MRGRTDMPGSILAMLATTFGPMVSESIVKKLLNSKGANSKMERAMQTTEKGVSVIAALRGEFGDEFLNAITSVIGDKNAHSWTYDAGTTEYIKLNITGKSQEALIILRDELNINLDRLVMLSEIQQNDLLNYFRGTFSVWKMRYTDIFGYDAESKKIFDVMDDLLDGSKRSFKDVLETLTKTSLGGVGALMTISGVLLATSTGVGLGTLITTFLFGIPWIAVGSLVIPGVILLGLSRYKFGSKHAMSTCIKLAYKLLEIRHTEMSSKKLDVRM